MDSDNAATVKHIRHHKMSRSEGAATLTAHLSVENEPFLWNQTAPYHGLR